MNKEKTLIPELRFTEFLQDSEWTESPLGDLCEVITKGTTPTTLGFKYTESGINFIKIESIDNGRINLSKVAHISSECNEALKRSQLSKNDILFSIAGALGVVAPIRGKDLPANTNQALAIVRLYEEINQDYVVKYLNSPSIEKEILKIKAGAAQPNISLTQVGSFSVLLPNPQEQQKIADCLSSLDALITAHNEKLEALKDHKKGLLQNLFPQEGETVPNVRFSEFVKDGEWVEKKLGKIGDPKMCKRIFKDQTTPNPEGGIPFYKIGTFGKEADAFISVELYNEYKEKYNFPAEGDILISASGTIGRLVVYDGSPAYFQDSNIVWLEHDRTKVKNEFLFYCYSILKWQTSDGGVIKRLYNTDLKNISIKFPKNEDEQIKISNSLATIDELISEQIEKIEELQKHKKGLTQGLFPKVED